MNNITFLKDVISLLEENRIKTWVFGGWGEELLGLIPAREHNDIDLLYPAKDFDLVDALLNKDNRLEEITAKRFHHKRAFVYKGVMIELFLLERENGKIVTNFWGTTLYQWPDNTLDFSKDGFRIANDLALKDYRNNHHKFAK